MNIITDTTTLGKANGDSEPPTGGVIPRDPQRPRGVSRLAYQDDGALLVSLQCAADRDLTGREVIAFMVLNDAEAADVRANAGEALATAAARTIGRLPKKQA